MCVRWGINCGERRKRRGGGRGGTEKGEGEKRKMEIETKEDSESGYWKERQEGGKTRTGGRGIRGGSSGCRKEGSGVGA